MTAHDRAGNTADSSFTVREDVTAPSTTDDTATIGSSWKTAPVTVTLTPSDARSGVAATYYTTDGSVPTTSSPEGTSVGLTDDGVYTIRYFSVDNVGNVEPVRTAFTTIRIDKTQPGRARDLAQRDDPVRARLRRTRSSSTPARPPRSASPRRAPTQARASTRSSSPSGVEDSSSPYSATYDLDDLCGSQTVTAHDAAGLTASDTFTVTPDTAAPDRRLRRLPRRLRRRRRRHDQRQRRLGRALRPRLGLRRPRAAHLRPRTGRLRTRSSAPGARSRAPTPFRPAPASATATASPTASATRPSTRSRRTRSRSTSSPPQTTVDVAPSDPSSDTSPSFEFSSNEGDATFECRLDGGAWSACTSPKSYAGLTDGSHTFQVRATDSAGLTDLDPGFPHLDGRHGRPEHDARRCPGRPVRRRRAQPSSSRRASPAPRSSARSTRAPGRRARAPRRSVSSPTAATPSPCAQPTRPATWTPPRRPTPGRSTPSRLRAPSRSCPPTRPTTPPRPSSSRRTSPAPPSSAASTAAPGRPARAPRTPRRSPTAATRSPCARPTQAGNQESTPESYTWLVDAGAPSVDDHRALGRGQRLRRRSVHGHRHLARRRRDERGVLPLLRRLRGVRHRLLGLPRIRHQRSVRGFVAARRRRQPRPPRRGDRLGLEHRRPRDRRDHRPHRPLDDDRLRPGRPERERRRELHVQLQRARRDLRVSPRRRRLGPVREPEELRQPRRGQPHLPGARRRRRGQRRPDPRQP